MKEALNSGSVHGTQKQERESLCQRDFWLLPISQGPTSVRNTPECNIKAFWAVTDPHWSAISKPLLHLCLRIIESDTRPNLDQETQELRDPSNSRQEPWKQCRIGSPGFAVTVLVV